MTAPSCGVTLAAGTPGEPEGHLVALREAAAACEAAGVELLLVDGRARSGPPERDLDPFSILGALGAATGSLRLGAIVAADERAPSLLAKATSTVDACSEGRAILVLAPPRRPRAREAALEIVGECVEVARAMLELPSPSVKGRHVAVSGAWNEPRSFAAAPPVGVVLPAATPGEARRLAGGWPAPPAFVLAAAAGPGRRDERNLGATAHPAEELPVLRLSAEPAPGVELRRGGFDGAVLLLARPEEATPAVLGRLREATRPAGS